MSNVISIQGYTLHMENGEPMVGDLELAEKLGYAQPYDIRKLIKRLLESGRISAEGIFATVANNNGGRGRPGTEYRLGEKATLKVIIKSETERADQITDEIIDVFIAARKGETKPTRRRQVDPVIEQHKQAVGVCRATLQLAKMMGTDLPKARAIAGERVEALTGVDVKPMLAGNTVEEAPVTPSVLGEELGISGRAMNKALLDAGLQVKDGKQWEPTEKASGLYTKNPFKSQSSDHTGYQLLWYKRALDLVTSGEAA